MIGIAVSELTPTSSHLSRWLHINFCQPTLGIKMKRKKHIKTKQTASREAGASSGAGDAHMNIHAIITPWLVSAGKQMFLQREPALHGKSSLDTPWGCVYNTPTLKNNLHCTVHHKSRHRFEPGVAAIQISRKVESGNCWQEVAMAQ